MPYNGRYYCNSIPKFKILVSDGTAKVVSVTTYSMNDYYEIFDSDGDPFTDRDKALKIADGINTN